MTTTHSTHTGTVHATARRLYDAECALHTAHQAHIDTWIAAASDNLHQALVDYLASAEREED